MYSPRIGTRASMLPKQVWPHAGSWAMDVGVEAWVDDVVVALNRRGRRCAVCALERNHRAGNLGATGPVGTVANSVVKVDILA